MTSSRLVRPARTLATPSSRRVSMPSSRATRRDLRLGRLSDGHFLDPLAHLHHREDADPAAVAALVAARAADRLVGLDLGADADLGVGERLRRHDRAPLAVAAELAREPLGDDAVDRRGGEEGLDPILVNRVTAPGASLVCSVVSIMCPVSAASIAIRAVSPSRISPTMTMSGRHAASSAVRWRSRGRPCG